MLKKIASIKKLAVFNDFQWDSSVVDVDEARKRCNASAVVSNV